MVLNRPPFLCRSPRQRFQGMEAAFEAYQLPGVAIEEVAKLLQLRACQFQRSLFQRFFRLFLELPGERGLRCGAVHHVIEDPVRVCSSCHRWAHRSLVLEETYFVTSHFPDDHWRLRRADELY